MINSKKREFKLNSPRLESYNGDRLFNVLKQVFRDAEFELSKKQEVARNNTWEALHFLFPNDYKLAMSPGVYLELLNSNLFNSALKKKAYFDYIPKEFGISVLDLLERVSFIYDKGDVINICSDFLEHNYQLKVAFEEIEQV